MDRKKQVAVFLGGRSPEHDVSVVTGLQVLAAVDRSLYEPFPVYVAPDGTFWVGDALRQRENYLPDAATRKQLGLQQVTLDVTQLGRGVLNAVGHCGWFSRTPEPVTFDIALLAFHGITGEDGNFQGMLEVAGIPYTGMRTMASAVLMDKALTKTVLAESGVPTLPAVLVRRPEQGLLLEPEDLAFLSEKLTFPSIVKPNHLGSSIGVAKVNSMDELEAVLPSIFKIDDAVIIEPFVANLVEYNVAVNRFGGAVQTSAIERPKCADELLDFKQKYLSGGGKDGGLKQGGIKTAGTAGGSEGMLSLTRELNPTLPKGLEQDLRQWATTCFELIGGTGSPRIDFLGNSKTGEYWLNEVNPCPGSFGYFLWEAAANPLLFTELLNHLLDEAKAQQRRRRLPADPTPPEARLFKRRF